MHVVFRRHISIQDCVDVFKMVSSGLLVPSVGLGVRSMEASSSSSNQVSLRE